MVFKLMSHSDVPKTTASSSESFNELAESLQQLRFDAGEVSYTDLATRISTNREKAGLTPEAARVARSSVYDVFRPDRKRVNTELVAEIVKALGASDEEAEQWRQRAVAARFVAATKPISRTRIIERHSFDELAHKRVVFLLSLVLCVAMVGLNHALNFTATALHLPLYLDMVGTAFAAFAFGPWAGAAVGIATNLIGNAMLGDFSGSWFALVQITGAVIWGYGFRRWFGRSPVRFFSLNVIVAVVCSLVAVPIILYAFGGMNSHQGVVGFTESLQQLGTSLTNTLFSVNLLTSLMDKLLSGYLAVAMLWLLVKNGFPLSEQAPGDWLRRVYTQRVGGNR